MTAYELPTSLNIGGVERKIRSDFRVVIDILMAMNDPELDGQKKTEVLIKIMYPGWRDIPREHLEEAARKACEFIDCGQMSGGAKRPKLVDWEQDAPLIIPAVNHVANTEVRAIPDLHWWTFFGWFMEIGDSVFSNVLYIREQKSRGKRLDKTTEEWYRKNRKIVDLKTRYTAEDDAFFAQFAPTRK